MNLSFVLNLWKMCVFFFFVSDDNIWGSNNPPIFEFSPSLNRKIHLFDTLGVESKYFQIVFKKIENRKQKNGNFTKNHFSTKSIFWFCCNSKTNHCKYLKFSPNVYIMVIYLQLNILAIFKLLIDKLKYSTFLSFYSSNADKTFLGGQKILKI